MNGIDPVGIFNLLAKIRAAFENMTDEDRQEILDLVEDQQRKEEES